jgi:ribosomal protein S27AE
VAKRAPLSNVNNEGIQQGRQTDDGYRLSGAGKQIARTVITVTGTNDLDFSADLKQDCPLCGALMAATYEDQWLRISCTECDGLFGDKTPEGAVFFSSYPAAGLTDRTPDEAFETGFYRCMLDITYMMRDVCRECAGSISASVSVCDTHRASEGEPCSRCGTRFPVWAEQRCDICRFAKRLPVEAFVMGLTPVIGFLDDEGLDVLAPTFDEIVDLLQNRVETTVVEEPFRVSVAIEGEAGRLSISLDDDMNVVGLDRQGPN